MKRYIITAGKERTALYNRKLAMNVYRFYENKGIKARIEIIEEQ